MTAFPRLSSSKMFNWLFKLGLTLGAFWFALRDVDLEHVIAILEEQRHDGIVWTMVLLLMQVLLGGARWHRILQAVVLGGERVLAWAEAIRIYYISVFFNCCLP